MTEEKIIHYFSGVGEANTEETLRAAKTRADELGIRDIVVASTRGPTGLKAVEHFKGYNVVVVPHVTGMREPGTQEMDGDYAEKIKAGGGRVVIAAHPSPALTGPSRPSSTQCTRRVSSPRLSACSARA